MGLQWERGMWQHHRRIVYNFQIVRSQEKKLSPLTNLLNNNLSEIKPSYMKGGLWIEHFGFLNLLYAWVTRAITNHISIGKYWLRYFLREEFKCLCRFYLIELKCYILYECRWFNKY